MYPTQLMPEDRYTISEMDLLRDWIKATKGRSIEEFERAAKPWSGESRAEIARILRELREIGFWPDRIGEDGRIIWGVLLKSEIQMEMERNADKYLAAGTEILHSFGSVRNAARVLAGKIND